MTTTLSGLQWLELLFLGGLMGVLGQGIRTFAGLKKVNDEADLRGVEFGDVFDRSVLFTSLALGFVAGAAAALTLVGTSGIDPKGYTLQVLLSFAAAGYAGSDFLEAFVKSTLPSQFKKPITTDFRHIPADVMISARTIAASATANEVLLPTRAPAPRTFCGHVLHVVASSKGLDDDQVAPGDKLSKHQYTSSAMPALAARLTNYFNEIGQPLRTIVHERELNPEQTVNKVCTVVKSHR